MTDIAPTAPIKFPALRAVRIRSPFLAIGRGFGTLLHAYCGALELAYLAPWTGPATLKGPAPEADLEGRDPNW